MADRVGHDALTASGTGAAEEWTGIPERAHARKGSPLDLRFNSGGFGASDHSSFCARGIPVFHFFSNTHPEYHRIEDDGERINVDGMARVTQLVAAVVREVVPGFGSRLAHARRGRGKHPRRAGTHRRRRRAERVRGSAGYDPRLPAGVRRDGDHER